jgi:hypothetical protein
MGFASTGLSYGYDEKKKEYVWDKIVTARPEGELDYSIITRVEKWNASI